jgi:hypothetical protein
MTPPEPRRDNPPTGIASQAGGWGLHFLSSQEVSGVPRQTSPAWDLYFYSHMLSLPARACQIKNLEEILTAEFGGKKIIDKPYACRLKGELCEKKYELCNNRDQGKGPAGVAFCYHPPAG